MSTPFDFDEWFGIDDAADQSTDKAALKGYLESLRCITVGTLKGLDFEYLPKETPIALWWALKSEIDAFKAPAR